MASWVGVALAFRGRSQVRRARSELTESDYLAAAAGLAPSEAKALPEALAKCLQENLCFDCKAAGLRVEALGGRGIGRSSHG